MRAATSLQLREKILECIQEDTSATFSLALIVSPSRAACTMQTQSASLAPAPLLDLRGYVRAPPAARTVMTAVSRIRGSMRTFLCALFVAAIVTSQRAHADSSISQAHTRHDFSIASALSESTNGPLFVAIRTPFGMERLRFEQPHAPAPMPYGSHNVGTSSVRAGTHRTHVATLSQFDSSIRIFFVSRRTGAPMSAVIRTRANRQILKTATPRFSRVRRIAALPCGSTPDISQRKHTPQAPGLGIYSGGSAELTSALTSGASLPFVPVREIDLRAFYDSSMQRTYAQTSPDYVVSAIHASNNLHLSQLGLRIRVMSIEPFELKIPEGESIEADIFLRIFRARVVGRKPRADLYHLFTGASLTGRTVGLAYVGGACVDKSAFAVGLSALVGEALQPIVLSHELGHGLGAVHDEVLPTVMSPFLGPGNNTFSAKSQDDIGRFVDNDARCITPAREDAISLSVDISRQVFSATFTLGAAAQGSCRVSLQTADLSRRARRSSRTKKPKWRTVTSITRERTPRQLPETFILAATSPIVLNARKKSYYFRGIARCLDGRFISGTKSVVPPAVASIQAGDMPTKDWISQLIANFRKLTR